MADLIVEIPDMNGIRELCTDYMYNGTNEPDIVINESDFDMSRFPNFTIEEVYNYFEMGRQFYHNLIFFDGMYIHSSAVELDGKAYLFSAPCGTGKSTHTRNWQKYFGENVHVFNDDKPALRKIDGVWYAYGTPWCGKDHININMKVPLAGICFLKQAPHNKIRRLTPFEAVQKILFQTIHKFKNNEKLDLMIKSINDLVSKIPVFELENLPDEEAVKLSYSTMLNAAKEAGL